MNIVPSPKGPYDAYIVGAGPVGCVSAERLAREHGWRVLVVERRDVPGGHCADGIHPSGVFVHRYGPHYFRTREKWLLDYLSRFTEWLSGNYIVKVSYRGRLYPFPINLDTLSMFFGRDLSPDEARALLEERTEKIASPANSEEFVLSRVGRELYEAFYLGYTLKQWARHPRDLAASVCGRIPVRFDCRNTYIDHPYQLTPKEGFTRLFTRMLDHERIDVMLEVDWRDVRGSLPPARATVYSGPVDQYFDECFGPLQYRSLRFDLVEYPVEFHQPCVQVNYPNEHDYTRSVEYKHITGQSCSNTVVAYEYPTFEGPPYYPIPAPDQQALYARYRALAEREERENGVYFRGRLARYVYLNMDEAMLEAFDCVATIAARHGGARPLARAAGAVAKP